MDVFRGVCLSACFLGTIFSIAEGMLPSEKYAGQIRTVFSLIFILVILAPFAEGGIALDISLSDSGYTADYSDITEIRLNEKICGNICDSINALLAENGINAVNISADINNHDDGSISITKAEVMIDDERKKAAAERMMKSALGDAEIIVNVCGEDEYVGEDKGMD